jgi:hypothetical protein
MSDYLQLPQSHLDAAFQQRIAQLRRAEEIGGRDSEAWRGLIEKPWVKATPYAPQTQSHCPHGHSHDAIVVGPEAYEGRPHIRRQCRVCPDWWLERLSDD